MAPTWTNSDFDQEATKIAKAFLAGEEHGGTPLNDLAEKVARDNGLNPEQIKRLCRNANTKTFELKHASMTGDERNPDFVLAEPTSVIQRLHSVHEARVKQASLSYVYLESEYERKVTSYEEKTAGEIQEVDTPKALRVKLAQVDRFLEESKHTSAFQADEWLVKMAELKELSSRIDFDYDEFEKNAVALFGSECFVEINKLRELKGINTFDKSASAHFDRLSAELIGKEDVFSRKLAEAIDTRKGFDQLSINIKKAMEIKVALESANASR